MSKYDYHTISLDQDYDASETFVAVYGWGTYGQGSVLEGQPKKVFIESFDSVVEAQRAYPDSEFSGPFTEPQNTFDHLPEYGDIEHMDDGY